jgi:hypothetical protein
MFGFARIGFKKVLKTFKKLEGTANSFFFFGS